MTGEVLLQLLAAIVASGGFASVVTALVSRRVRQAEVRHLMAAVEKTSAEAVEIEVRTYQEAVEIAMNLARGLSKRISDLEGKLHKEQEERCLLQVRFNRLDQRYQRLLAGVRVLMGQLHENGIQPAWLPDEDGEV